MPGRKRDNPQRLDVGSAAKRQELFQFVPKHAKEKTPTAAACADSALLPHDSVAALSHPLTEISNTTTNDNSGAQTPGKSVRAYTV